MSKRFLLLLGLLGLPSLCGAEYSVVRVKGKFGTIVRVSDGAVIPIDTRNKDYRAFLLWQAQQQFPLDLSDQAFDSVAANKAAAKAALNDLEAQNRLLRAIVKLVVDENNLLREWLADFKTETAATSSLADFKSRVATLPNMPNRTYDQAKTVIDNLVDGE